MSQDLAPSFDPNIQVANDCPRIMFFGDPNASEINTKAMLAMHNTFCLKCFCKVMSENLNVLPQTSTAVTSCNVMKKDFYLTRGTTTFYKKESHKML